MANGVRRDAALILLYHRVATIECDPWALAVSPSRFAAQMAVLRRFMTPVTLAQLVTGLANGGLPPRAVAVTFDDGYADNLACARAILARYDIPATLFLTADAIGSPRAFWWDELATIFLRPGHLPHALTIVVGDEKLEWRLGDSAAHCAGNNLRQRQWRAWMRPPTVRHAIFFEIWQRLRRVSLAERERVLAVLFAWCGRERTAYPDDLPLTAAAVATLRTDPLIEPGAHTRTHPSLTALPTYTQHAEIAGSKTMIEAFSGRPVVHFSYPFGGTSDYSAATIAAVAAAGFHCACTGRAAAVHPGISAYALPRCAVQDWTGPAFALRLARWFATGTHGRIMRS